MRRVTPARTPQQRSTSHTRAKIEKLARKACRCRAPRKCACALCAPSKRPNARVIYKADPSDQFYTPRKLRELVWSILESVDLDPATSRRNPLRAAEYFTREGLERSWLPMPDRLRAAWRVFLNPPFGLGIVPWVAKLIELAQRLPHAEILALLPARPGAGWYKRVTRACQCFVELDGRVTFEDSRGNPILGKDGKPQPARWGVVIVYFGPDRARVWRLMKPHGEVRPGGTRNTYRKPKPITVDARQERLAFDAITETTAEPPRLKITS